VLGKKVLVGQTKQKGEEKEKKRVGKTRFGSGGGKFDKHKKELAGVKKAP